MGKTRNRYFNLGLALAAGLAISARSATAESGIRSEIVVHVYNYARVDQETLAEAEKVAAGILGRNRQYQMNGRLSRPPTFRSAFSPAMRFTSSASRMK